MCVLKDERIVHALHKCRLSIYVTGSEGDGSIFQEQRLILKVTLSFVVGKEERMVGRQVCW